MIAAVAANRITDLAAFSETVKIHRVEIPAKPGVFESGLYVTVGPLILSNGKQIADFATKGKLPSIQTSRAGIDAGGLMYRGDGSQSKLFSLLYPPNE